MKSSITIACMLLCSIKCFSQQAHKVRINTTERTILSGCFNREFLDGRVIYKDGSYGKAKLNYNCVTQEMLFISPKNDTLKLNKPEETLMVTIATDTFSFFVNTFVRKITHYDNAVNLFQKIDLKHIDNEKKQAYGYSSVTGDQASTTFVNSMGGTNYLEVDQNLVYVRSGDLYISNNKGDFFPVKSSSFNKIYPQYRSQIIAFSKSNKTDWDEPKDIIKLMEYLQQTAAGASKPQ